MAYIPGRKRQPAPEDARPIEAKKDPRARRHDRAKHGDLDVKKLEEAYVELGVLHRHLRESQTEMILSFALAAEYKDPDTGSHILRISDYATEVAKALNLPEAEVEILRYASTMHDIGKIGIPDKILQKPGKLTDSEWEIMKQHTVIGSKIFNNTRSPLLKAVAEIALTHHEKYDGTGYPQGLRGEAIPLFGRIVAMVDVFDAVTTERCYKSKSTFQEGLAYVEKLSGTHLDPKLVSLFRSIETNVFRVYEAGSTVSQFVHQHPVTETEIL